MAKQLPARRRSSGALTAAKMDLTKVRSQLASTRRKARESIMPAAFTGAAATLAGAAAIGAAKELLGEDEFMGVPIEAIALLALGTAGAMSGQPLLLHFAAGAAAPFVSDWAADMVGGLDV